MPQVFFFSIKRVFRCKMRFSKIPIKTFYTLWKVLCIQPIAVFLVGDRFGKRSCCTQLAAIASTFLGWAIVVRRWSSHWVDRNSWGEHLHRAQATGQAGDWILTLDISAFSIFSVLGLSYFRRRAILAIPFWRQRPWIFWIFGTEAQGWSQSFLSEFVSVQHL